MPLTAAFIVHLAVPDLTRLPETAEDIFNACDTAGLDVQSVEPWARPVTSPQLDMENSLLSGQISSPTPLGNSPNLGA